MHSCVTSIIAYRTGVIFLCFARRRERERGARVTHDGIRASVRLVLVSTRLHGSLGSKKKLRLFCRRLLLQLLLRKRSMIETSLPYIHVWFRVQLDSPATLERLTEASNARISGNIGVVTVYSGTSI